MTANIIKMAQLGLLFLVCYLNEFAVRNQRWDLVTLHFAVVLWLVLSIWRKP